MPGRKLITKYVSDWLKRAAEDVRAAEILLREGGLPNSICFHCHQSAEKYLKAFLAFRERHVRKIHDIEMLLTLCAEIDESFKTLQSDASYLSKFYIETRYPGDYQEFTLKEAQKAFDSAKIIENFVLAQIKKPKQSKG